MGAGRQTRKQGQAVRVHPVYYMGAGLLPVASHRPLGVLRPALCASGDASLEMGMTRKVFQPSQRGCWNKPI